MKAARFPVTIVHDGSDDAQLAGLDEITGRVCDAISGLRGAHRIAARVGTEAIRSIDYPAVVIDVDVVLDGQSFCAPAAIQAEVPPPLVQFPEEG